MSELIFSDIKNILILIPGFFESLDSSKSLYYISNLIIFYILFQTARMMFILILNKQLAFKSDRWIVSNTSGKKQILILGDSTAVGTGASSVSDTLSGRLMHDFPDAQITNLGVNGSLIMDISNQIKKVSSQKYDLIIISSGGNDVWNMTRKSIIYRHLGFIFKETTRMSNGRVFFLLYNNIGDAPIFPKFIRFFLRARCRSIQNQIERITYTMNVSLINIFSDDKDNPFIKNPKKFFADDGIHPSSLGYQLWYHRMWLELVKIGFKL